MAWGVLADLLPTHQATEPDAVDLKTRTAEPDTSGTARREVAVTEYSVTTLLPSPFTQRTVCAGRLTRGRDPGTGEQDRQSSPPGTFTLLTVRVTRVRESTGREPG